MANLSNINNKFLVTTGGNVGIGTTSPSAKLTIQGTNSANGGIKIQNSGGNPYAIYSDNNDLLFTNGNGSTTALGITYSGTITGTGTYTAGNSIKIFEAQRSGGAVKSDWSYDDATTDMSLGTSTAHSFSLKTNDTRALTINNSQNVGIGTTAPNHKLDIYSNENVPLRIHRPSNANLNSSGAWGIGFSTRGDAITSTTDTRAGIFSYYNGNLFFATNNSSIVADPDASARMTILNNGNVGIGTVSPDGMLEVAGGSTLGFRLSNAGDNSAYDQVRFTYGGYNSGAPTVTFMPLTTPGSGNVDTTFHFMNTNGLGSNNNRANVNIDGILYVGSGRQSGETTLIMRNYDDTLVNTGSIQNSIRMSGRYWSGSASQLVETRINSVHQESNGNGGSALTFWTQTGGDAPNEKLRIDKSGRVIVYQKQNVSGFYLDGGNTRLYANGGGGTDYRGIECNSSGMWSWGETGSSNFFANKVGIGTNSPITKLQTNLTIIGSYLSYLNGTSVTFDAQPNIAAVHNSPSIGNATAAGLMLVNNDNSNGAPSPIIAFSAKSASNSYNHTYAAIYGIKTATGADTNWTKGDLVLATGSGTGPNERMRITSAGNVQIGTTNDAAKLNVGGPILAQDNNQSAGMYVRRSLNLVHPGNTGTFTKTFNPVTQFGISRLGGNVLLEVSGWSQRLNCGYIQFQNAGGSGNITTVSYTQIAIQGNGSISVSVNSANDNSIDINFSGWHGNSHAFQAKIVTQ